MLQNNRAWCENGPRVHINCRFYMNESYITVLQYRVSAEQRTAGISAVAWRPPHSTAARLTRTLTQKQALQL